MSGRPGPRLLTEALEAVAARAAPATLLGRVQQAWPEAAGETLVREAQPVAERGGTITLACRSGVWAQELELMAPELLARLRASLGKPSEEAAALRGLRFVVGPVGHRA